MHSRVGAVATLLFRDLLGSVAWFPVWWYTKGLTMLVQKIGAALRYRIRAYAFGIWMRNLFVPMYGQTDIGGRAVSVVMRLVVLIGRGVAFVAEAILYGVAIVLWCVWIPMTLLLLLSNVI